MTARIDKAKIKKYDHLLGICHRRAQDEQDPELREAFSVLADAYGWLIMSEERRV